MSQPRFRLGAEELIELGREGRRPGPGREPYLAGRLRNRAALGQMPAAAASASFFDQLSNSAKFIADQAALSIATLSDLVGIPVAKLSENPEATRLPVAELFQVIPVAVDLAAQALLFGGALLKFGLSTSDLGARSLGNVLAGLARATAGIPGMGDRIDQAKTQAAKKAPEGIRKDVESVLGLSGVSGANLLPATDSLTGEPKAISPEEISLLSGSAPLAILAFGR